MPETQLSESSPTADVEPPERSFQVQVANETAATIDLKSIASAVRHAFADAPYDEITVSVAIVDDETIHDLNRQFLAHDYPTDVLSFALEDDPPRVEGEIVVSIDTAERGAAEVGWQTEHELLLYVAHGALHLAGYRDKSPDEAAEMHAAEAEVLDLLGVERSPRDSRWHDAAPLPPAQEELPQ